MQMHRFSPSDFISAKAQDNLKSAAKWLHGVMIAALAVLAKDELVKAFDAIGSLIWEAIMHPA